MRQGKVVAIIPTRKGSQRVKDKNTKRFGDTNLLEHKIKQLKKIKDIDEIILTTDCKKSMEIGRKHNIKILIREKYYASSECNNSDFFKNIAEQTDENCKYLVYTPVTSPFVKNETIQKVIRKFIETEEYDSVIPVENIKHHMWMDGKPLNYNINEAPNTQDLPDVYALNYCCSIISRKDQIKYKNLCGKNPYFLEISQMESIDIDTIFDFELSQMLYKNSSEFI